MRTSDLDYKRAFDAYLRRGVPIELALKQDRATTPISGHYIWRTRGDGRVRPSHAANYGKIFAWDNPPPTGHPGEDYGCRCTAEPYSPAIDESMSIRLENVIDMGSSWDHENFIQHYYHGRGIPVRLRDTGHLRRVVDEYMHQVERDLLGQIADAARVRPGAALRYTIVDAYEMEHVVFSLGGTTIGGIFTGRSKSNRQYLHISGRLYFYQRDAFTDPLYLSTLVDPLDIIGYEGNLPGSQPYDIYDEWFGSLVGIVHRDRSRSSYRYE